ncbi:MAG TPA: hypothetical protein VD907_01455 [Verrucomicrobiae bacterium]|nr:hypothetical protein [Verrucomicrobiae bacterium]
MDQEVQPDNYVIEPGGPKAVYVDGAHRPDLTCVDGSGQPIDGIVRIKSRGQLFPRNARLTLLPPADTEKE